MRSEAKQPRPTRAGCRGRGVQRPRSRPFIWPKGTTRHRREPFGTNRNQPERNGTKRNETEPNGTIWNRWERFGTQPVLLIILPHRHLQHRVCRSIRSFASERYPCAHSRRPVHSSLVVKSHPQITQMKADEPREVHPSLVVKAGPRGVRPDSAPHMGD